MFGVELGGRSLFGRRLGACFFTHLGLPVKLLGNLPPEPVGVLDAPPVHALVLVAAGHHGRKARVGDGRALERVGVRVVEGGAAGGGGRQGS